MKLSEAMNRLPAAHYRKLLREAVSQLPDRPSNATVYHRAWIAGSLFKFHKTPTVTYSALRDRLPIDILLALTVGKVSWDDVLNAFGNPDTHCRGFSGMAGKKYTFAWPSSYAKSEAYTVMRRTKMRDYDEYAEKTYPHIFTRSIKTAFAPTPPIKPITEKTMNLNEMGVDEVYETAITLAATKLSLLNTQAEMAGVELDAFTISKNTLDAKVAAFNLIEKHFGREKAEGANEIMKLNDKLDLSNYAGTENANAAFAVRKIVGEDSAAFRHDIKGEAAPLEEVVLAIKPEMKMMLDLVLSQATEGKFANSDALVEKMKLASSGVAKVGEENARLKRLLAAKPVISLRAAVATSTAGTTLPTGTIITVKAGDIFLSPEGRKHRSLNFDIPAFDWAGADHPYVPTIDKNYIFKPSLLLKFLWAILKNKKIWLHGHTGSGKTAFVEQVCARLGWPFFRINLDSEITRMDMIGRDTLSSDGKGATISKFVDGILPQAMTLQGHGGMLCVDEVSFGRPDVMYVFQRVLEDKGLLMAEDGGRLVQPGDMFRIVATDNTRGQGDEFGAYAGARPQSAAFLDRFQAWLEFEYLNTKEETRLLLSRVPELPATEAEQIASFATEVRTAFRNGSIYQTLTPRGTVALAESYLFFQEALDGNRANAITMASEETILSKASDNDKSVIKGLFDRTFR